MDDEVVDELAVPVERLGADAGGAGQHVPNVELRDEAAQFRDEGALAGGVSDLGQPGSPETSHQTPGPGPGQVGAEIPAAQAGNAVGVTGPDHQGRGAEQDLAVDRPGQVAAEERQVRV